MTFTNEVFIAKVRDMRDMQRRYFQHRSTSLLKASKSLEKEVDGMLVKIAASQGELTL